MRKIWREYFEDLHSGDTGEWVTVSVCEFDGARRGNYFEREPVRRTEVKVRTKMLENVQAADKDEVAWEWR